MQPDNLNHDSRTRPIAKMDVERAMLEQANYQTVALKAIADSVQRIADAFERAYPIEQNFETIESSFEGDELTIQTDDTAYASVMVAASSPDVVQRFVGSVLRIVDEQDAAPPLPIYEP